MYSEKSFNFALKYDLVSVAVRNTMCINTGLQLSNIWFLIIVCKVIQEQTFEWKWQQIHSWTHEK